MSAMNQGVLAPRIHPVTLRTLHWLTALLLAGPYAAIWAVPSVAEATADTLAMLHRSCGITVLGLTLLRLLRRAVTPPLTPPPDIGPAQQWAARANVAALYALLLLQPALGIAGTMLSGEPATVFGPFLLPRLLPLAPHAAERLFTLHGWVAMALLALVALHVAAALHHHFIRRDGVLAAMFPFVRTLR